MHLALSNGQLSRENFAADNFFRTDARAICTIDVRSASGDRHATEVTSICAAL